METHAGDEYLNISEIKLGWVIFLHKPPPPSEYLKFKWANTYCKNDCHLKEKGYGYPIAIVDIRNLQDERIKISFVQVSLSPVLSSDLLYQQILNDHNAVRGRPSNSILLAWRI